jgi:hypothetical protein|uniref:Uncharacterized protein n=1 Tax=Podoviridae sp. ctZ5d16 TaxID=2825257 RepID=A0A8S5Q801_9CAUD|nr:MAG TPA: hypothetical protein [Podoviridae sp. ctZ5d16]
MEVVMVEKELIIKTMKNYIEMPDQTEMDYEKKEAYRRCLEDLGLIQKKS